MIRYEIHPRQKHRETLIQVVNGRAVNLAGKPAVKKHPATPSAAAWEQKIPAATQKDLKTVFESGARDVDGFPLIVAVEVPDKEKEAEEKSSKRSKK